MARRGGSSDHARPGAGYAAPLRVGSLRPGRVAPQTPATTVAVKSSSLTQSGGPFAAVRGNARPGDGGAAPAGRTRLRGGAAARLPEVTAGALRQLREGRGD